MPSPAEHSPMPTAGFNPDTLTDEQLVYLLRHMSKGIRTYSVVAAAVMQSAALRLAKGEKV